MERWLEKLIKYIEKTHHIPQFFETYNCYEVKDFAPTITSKVGMLNGSSNILVITYE